MNRRDLIRGIGTAICAGFIPSFIPQLIGCPYALGPTVTLPIGDLDMFLPGDKLILSDGDWGYGIRKVVDVSTDKGVIVLR